LENRLPGKSVDGARQDGVVPRVEAEGVSAGVVDDQDVAGFDLGKRNVFGDEVALKAERSGDVVGLGVLVGLHDAGLVGDRVTVTPLSGVVAFANELCKKKYNLRI
jgi:hypothetical protein